MKGVEMATFKIEISGDGGEFQHHYLSVKELKEIIKVGKKGGGEAVVDEFLTGGKMFDKTNYGGAYGCSTDAIFTVNGKKFKPTNFVLEKKIDDKTPFSDGGNLYYIAKGEVTGSVDIEVEGKFDPKLLEIHYVEFEILEGWKSGKIISQIHYAGEEYFGEFTDDGQEYEHVGCIYKVDKKGTYKETDIFLMYDADENEWKIDAMVISNSGLI
jgi:hypothetical protein